MSEFRVVDADGDPYPPHAQPCRTLDAAVRRRDFYEQVTSVSGEVRMPARPLRIERRSVVVSMWEPWNVGAASGLRKEDAHPDPPRFADPPNENDTVWMLFDAGGNAIASQPDPAYPAASPDERLREAVRVNALLSEQLEEARRWHLTAVNEKRAAQADAERLFTALDGYIMARITGTDLRDYDDLAERAARAHRALATDVPGKLDRTVLDPETGIEEPVTTGRIPDAEFVEPPLMPPAASPDERLREALRDIHAAAVDHNQGWLRDKCAAALAAADREAPDEARGRKITHGRHCTCSACAAEDWTNPALSPCGMHGKDCPQEYQPLGPAGSFVPPVDPDGGKQ